MRTIPLAQLRAKARRRPADYFATVVAAGEIVGDAVQLTNADYDRLCAKYRPTPSGLGDIVHAIAHPIAKAIDTVAGTKIANCGGCQKRREALNRAFPKPF